MRHVRRTLVTVVVTALVGAVLTAAPASARPYSPRDAGRDGHHYPVAVSVSVPPGGYTSVATPTLPKDAQVLTVTVKPPSDATDAAEEAFKNISQIFAAMSRKKRLLTCLEFHKFVMQDMDDSEEAQINEENSVLALLILGACLQAAGLLSPDSRPAGTDRADVADRASRGKAKSCQRRPFRLPAELTKADGKFQIAVDGTASKAKNPKLRVSCKVRGLSYTYKVRAAKKGTPLRKVAGARLGIGLRSPADSETDAPAVVKFDVR